MIYLYTGLYSRQLCQQHPDLLWVFGDNAGRVGNGGQAVIRPEPNAFGVATKRSVSEYMADGVPRDMTTIGTDLANLEVQLARKHSVVLPVFNYGATTLGTGLAELPMRAPTLYRLINDWQSRVTRLVKTQKGLPNGV